MLPSRLGAVIVGLGQQARFQIRSRVSAPPKAVFLSYASQDAEAARRICDALRAVGLDVWFDQSALRGGDAWDAKIRKQINDCTLFLPVISQHTQERSTRATSASSGNWRSSRRT